MTASLSNEKSGHKKTAHLFPAFVPEYLGIETSVIESYGIKLQPYLDSASELTGENLSEFDIIHNNLLGNQLKSQYITYIISCCISDLLHEKKILPDYISSYSMGIYAALYHCGSIDFGTGLQMITAAFSAIENNLPAHPQAMCSIGGLNSKDIREIMQPYIEDVYIINQNSEYSFLLSGQKNSLEHIVQGAVKMGALQTRMLPVTHPYHSPLLKNASTVFNNVIKKMSIGENRLPYVSAVTREIIKGRNDIIAELTSNIFNGFHWHKTFLFLLDKGVDTFIECGAGDSLYRLGKFIEGDFNIVTLKKIHKIC
ncbi:MAG TPA: hypothetical protein PLI16_06850 [Bacteroidales bacterium]|jgi:[acyl-carrier-protein] S-malonyltransferase|nr:ACP S-malonyltransferase [Bacteroidales bacterium]HNZ41910.1 hypothetical protein [Bacteroidales bacterium]HOH84316.1 hypothetical protein [Bacteroidales bacterium]